MQSPHSIFVVGDKFKDFGQHEQVLTLKELTTLLQAPDLSALHNVRLIAGQGISEADVQHILALSKNSKLDTSLLLQRPVRAGMATTHKRRFVNSIISTPRQLDSDLFEADLLVDERSELMNDHQTGQHIQGMILVEAARQLFLAVTEEFFIAPDDHRDYYFVINQMDVKYMAFVFPIGASLRYEIVEKNLSNPERLSFLVRITVQQAGVEATEVMVKFTTFLAEKIKQKEHQQAMQTLSKQQQNLPAANSEKLAA
ncbi:MAG: hypothetical protein HYZ45_10105 [Burkholderiales bacterium]|nr:hypothetical protein [Burkholderiales bacterium]